MLGLIVLFILLSPGFLLTIPAIGGRYFRTNKTSPTAVIVHGIIFGLIVYLVRKYYSRTFFEGFANGRLEVSLLPIQETVIEKRAIIENKIKEINDIIQNHRLNDASRRLLNDLKTKLSRISSNLKQGSEDHLNSAKNVLATREQELSRLSASVSSKIRKEKTDAVTRSRKAVNDITKRINDRLTELENVIAQIPDKNTFPLKNTLTKVSSSLTMPRFSSSLTMPRFSSSLTIPQFSSIGVPQDIPSGSSSYPMPPPIPPTESRGPGIAGQIPRDVGARFPGF